MKLKISLTDYRWKLTNHDSSSMSSAIWLTLISIWTPTLISTLEQQLHYLMFITTFSSFWLLGNPKFSRQVESQSPAKHLVGFEPTTFQVWCLKPLNSSSLSRNSILGIPCIGILFQNYRRIISIIYIGENEIKF